MFELTNGYVLFLIVAEKQREPSIEAEIHAIIVRKNSRVRRESRTRKRVR